MRQTARNTKELWEIINDIIGKQREQTVLPETIDEDVVENFNAYFAGIGPSLAQKFNESDSISISPTPLPNTFFKHNIEPEDVIATVNKMSTFKASGLDGIPIRMIKKNIDILGLLL